MTTVRVLFSKTGRAKYISHLDLNRTMARAVRRAGIPIWYTEGFNRHPYITFAAPLSLGFEGLRESMDFRLEGEMSFLEITERLDAVLPEGLHILSSGEAVMKPGDIIGARYRLTMDCPVETLREFLAQEHIPVSKKTKKKTMKEIDLKPVLEKAALEIAEGPDDRTTVTLTLPCGSSDSVNPTLVVEAIRDFAGLADMDWEACRLDVLAAEGKPFC